MTDPFALAAAAARELQTRTGIDRHDVFVVLGSGWADAASRLPDGVDVPMAALPGFPTPGVRAHVGALRSVPCGGARLLLALGRVHLYEGHPPETVVHAVRTAASAGCRVAVLTNAAGIINPAWAVGSPVVIADQINVTGASPLAGAEFVDLSDLYSARLRALVSASQPGLASGVYVGTRGPEFETPAEIRAYRVMGADLVGMSTVLEAIAARHIGMEVFGLAMGTNLAAGVSSEPVDPHHVWDVAAEQAPAMGALLVRILETLVADGSDVAALITEYALAPIPGEGGWFHQTWCGSPTASGAPLGTAIVGLFADEPDGFSAFHRLASTEVWHFYRGDPLELVLLHPDGHSETCTLGPGASVQAVVPAGTWMAARVAPGGRFSLTGATMAPGFTDDGFELGARDALIAAYPAEAERIAALTRE